MATQQSAVPGGIPGPATVLSGGRTTTVSQALADGDALWLRAADLPAATGWEIKPEGVCRDEACIPLTGSLAAQGTLRRDDETWLDVTALARHAGQPFAHESAERVWSFGPPAYERQSRAASDRAPDFTLPDFDGRLHSLSDYAGKKIFLLTWASW